MDFRKLAKMYGYSDQEIEEFLRVMPSVANQPSKNLESGMLPKPQTISPTGQITAPTIQAPSIQTPSIQAPSVIKPSLVDLAKQAGYSDTELETMNSMLATRAGGDVVSPVTKESPITQQFNQYNPGMGYYNDVHKGTDIGGDEGQEIKFPVGGTVLQKGYDPVYGWNVDVIGQNLQERAQMDPNNPNPESQVVHISHLAEEPGYRQGDYVATGSGGLKMGSSGKSTGTHIDFELRKLKDIGNYANYQDILDLIRRKAGQ